MVTVGAPRTSQPFPSIWLAFCFQIFLGCRKTSTLSTQRCYSPNASFVGLFFSFLALFLAFNICTNKIQLPKNDHEGLNIVSEEMEYEEEMEIWRNGIRISVWSIPSGKTGLLFQMFRYSQKFSAGKTKKVVFHILPTRFSVTFCKW